MASILLIDDSETVQKPVSATLGVEGFVAKGEDFSMVLLLEIERVLGAPSDGG